MSRGRDPRDDTPRARYRMPPGPIATLGQLRRNTCWVWLYCNGNGCCSSVPIALAPLIIRWGYEVSSDVLRRSARRTRSGTKGATLAEAIIIVVSVEMSQFSTQPGADKCTSPTDLCGDEFAMLARGHRAIGRVSPSHIARRNRTGAKRTAQALGLFAYSEFGPHLPDLRLILGAKRGV
jgi:hypothetical protein